MWNMGKSSNMYNWTTQRRERMEAKAKSEKNNI